MNQNQIPLITKLKQLAQQQQAPFYAPGHKKGYGIARSLQELMGDRVFRADLPELPELDNLFAPEGVIKEAQTLASEAFGAEQTWFLANGSTSGIIASILATCGEGDQIILPRNVHQSAIFGLILSGATPIFLEPQYDRDFALCHQITVEQITEALKTHKNIRAVLLVSPTYYGVCANLTRITHCVHEYNIPVIVDEAHGGHFHFHPQLPTSALKAGADVVIQSTHKVLGAMTQASMLHLQGNLVEDYRLGQGLQMVQSSSPNYLLLASLDGARQQMAVDGYNLLERTCQLATDARNQLASVDYLQVLDKSHISNKLWDLDITRLTVNVSRLGLSGYQADEIFGDELGVICELPSLQTLTFIISLGNQQLDIDNLVQAFVKLENYRQSSVPSTFQLPTLPPTKSQLTPRQAFQMPKKVVNKNQGVNQISGETICPYPPGIPIIMAGEIITSEALDYVSEVISQGGMVTGIIDRTFETIQIIS